MSGNWCWRWRRTPPTTCSTTEVSSRCWRGGDRIRMYGCARESARNWSMLSLWLSLTMFLREDDLCRPRVLVGTPARTSVKQGRSKSIAGVSPSALSTRNGPGLWLNIVDFVMIPSQGNDANPHKGFNLMTSDKGALRGGPQFRWHPVGIHGETSGRHPAAKPCVLTDNVAHFQCRSDYAEWGKSFGPTRCTTVRYRPLCGMVHQHWRWGRCVGAMTRVWVGKRSDMEAARSIGGGRTHHVGEVRQGEMSHVVD